jgi:hypothetical protein
MIKFFRKFRQKLLSENKFSKYLIYAIGEIILVVIGILIALQINNWNEIQKRNDEERKLLHELIANLEQDINDHEVNIEFNRAVGRAADYIIESIESRTVWNDTMQTHYGYLLRHGLSTFNTSAYDNLKTKGFDLISNDSIRIALTNLHGVTYTAILRFEQELAMDNQTYYLAPLFLQRIRMENPWFKGIPHDYSTLLDDKEFLEAVRWKAKTIRHVAIFQESGLKRANQLIAMIERELKK